MTDLDEVLERFQLTALEYGPGLANHGPMAAEAIVALGHGALLTGWVDLYAPRLPPLAPGRRLSATEQTAALGDPKHMADWVATFEAELAERDWRSLLRARLPGLAPGLFASAAHGFLRVAHAVRALEREETAPRRREIAFGLGLWAARYQTLPGEPGARARRDPAAVLQTLEPVPSELRRPGLFFDAVRVLDDRPGFADAVESADLGVPDLLDLVGALARAGARLYLAQPHARVGYAHVVTVASAVRLLAGVAPPDTLRALAGYAFQSGCALHAVLAAPEGLDTVVPDLEDAVADAEVERLAGDTAEIRYRAACSLREHAIKLAEACLREDAITPDPLLRRGAADAAVALEGERAWSDTV